jgi:hypothetical protein
VFYQLLFKNCILIVLLVTKNKPHFIHNN